MHLMSVFHLTARDLEIAFGINGKCIAVRFYAKRFYVSRFILSGKIRKNCVFSLYLSFISLYISLYPWVLNSRGGLE